MPQRGGNRDSILLYREAYWIHFLATLIPKGLTEEISFTCFTVILTCAMLFP